MEETIDTTICSVVSQEGNFSLHYHIQDNCSTDGTAEKIENWKSLISSGYPIIRCRDLVLTYSVEADNGMYDAIKKSIEYMNIPSDAIVSYINADDFLFQGAVATVCRIFSDIEDCRWIQGGQYSVNSDTAHRMALHQKYVRNKEEVSNGLCDGIHLPFIQQEGVFWKHSLWRDVGGINGDFRLAGDWDLWRRFAEICDFVLAPYAFGAFRMGSNRLSEDIEPYRREMDTILALKERSDNMRRVFKESSRYCNKVYFDSSADRYRYAKYEITSDNSGVKFREQKNSLLSKLKHWKKR